VNSELKVLRTHDDSRPAKPLPSFALDRAAKIRIGAKRAKAQHELLQGLIDYLGWKGKYQNLKIYIKMILRQCANIDGVLRHITRDSRFRSIPR
jgi:hypothetical protein